jgi:protein phosphatase
MDRAQSPKTSMTHSEPRIHCSNPNCGASNRLEAKFCHRCKTPLLKRYLWTIEEIISKEQVKQLVGDRYFALTNRIVLDTKPGTQPQTPEEVPPKIVNYLQLFSYYPHIPQVYGQLNGTEVWLLDYGTVPIAKTGKLRYPQLIPELTSLWSAATPFQQLKWLRQMAHLWQPMVNKKVASSLLHPELIRVNGQVVQFLQLKYDRSSPPSLKQLGKLWSEWAEHSDSSIKGVLVQLTNRLETGAIEQPGQIMSVLDRALDLCRRSHEYIYQVYAITESGPNRNNNQDAVYPSNSQITTIPNNETSLTIVCDGVGGHEGGEIASKETIKCLESNIAQLSFEEQHNNPAKIFKQLTQYINESNDLISKRNDSEQRQERQRMGTTLVMTLAHAHEIYLGHVGDSRIYWITPTSCHQVTVDDDLASREVRLGYAVYRDSLQYPSAGALIQALGMRDSSALHPNLQRHIIDDDCIFLLCSDGLSDFDRVEQHWRHTILPIFEGTKDLVTVVKTLIRIANEKNGHDNATVALLHCQVKSPPDVTKRMVSWSDVELGLDESSIWSELDLTAPVVPETQTPDTYIPDPVVQETNTPKRSPKWLKYTFLVLVASMIVGTIFYLFLSDRINNPDNNPDNHPEKESLNSQLTTNN